MEGEIYLLLNWIVMVIGSGQSKPGEEVPSLAMALRLMPAEIAMLSVIFMVRLH